MNKGYLIALMCASTLSVQAQPAELFPGDKYLTCAVSEYKDYNECITNRGDYPKNEWPAVCTQIITNIPRNCGKVPGSFFPSYVILALLYAPPGNASNTQFSKSATSGTSTTMGDSSSQAVDIGITVDKTVGSTLSISDSSGTSTTFQTTLNSTTGDVVKSVKDAINHSQDTFYLWMNAQFTPEADNTHKIATLSLAPAGGPFFDIVPISVAELQHPSTISASKLAPQQFRQSDGSYVTLPGLNILNEADFATILSFDPFVSGDPSAQPKTPRFFDTGLREPLEGPPTQGSDQLAYTATLTAGQQVTLSQTTSESYTEGASLSIPLGDLAGSLGLKTTETITSAQSTSSGSGQQTSAQLGSSTFGCCNSSPSGQGGTCQIEIYEDMLFQTYAFVPEPVNCGGVLPPSSVKNPSHPNVLGGLVFNSSGLPAVHAPVTINLPGGRSIRVLTDSQGRYSLYEAPAGTARVAAGALVKTVKLGGGKSASVTLRQR